MKSGKLIILAVLVAAAALATAADVRAQGPQDHARLLDEFARNGELLERAKELVGETSSIKARASLATAAKLHLESSRMIFETQNYSLAAGLVKRTREVLLQTISLAKREAKLEENAFKAIERATRTLEHARQLLDENSSTDMEPARKLVHEAHAQLERSRDNMNEHLYEVAFRLAVSSDQLSRRAITLLKREVGGPEEVEREIEKTDRILERIQESAPEGADLTSWRY